MRRTLIQTQAHTHKQTPQHKQSVNNSAGQTLMTIATTKPTGQCALKFQVLGCLRKKSLQGRSVNYDFRSNHPLRWDCKMRWCWREEPFPVRNKWLAGLLFYKITVTFESWCGVKATCLSRHLHRRVPVECVHLSCFLSVYSYIACTVLDIKNNVCTHACKPRCGCGVSRFSHFTIWVPGTELRLSGLAEVLLPNESSCWPEINKI